MTLIQDQYDNLLTTMFGLLQEYQHAIKLAEDHQAACYDLMIDCERQNGLYSTQLNSSSYFSVSLSAHLQVQLPTHDTSQILIIDRPLTLSTNVALTADSDNTNTQDKGNIKKSSNNYDDDSDDDENLENRIYTPPQLLNLFALAPSMELLKLQQGWNEYIQHHIPQIYKMKTLLLCAIEQVEVFKQTNQTALF